MSQVMRDELKPLATQAQFVKVNSCPASYEVVDLLPSSSTHDADTRLKRLQKQNDKLQVAATAFLTCSLILGLLLGLATWQTDVCENQAAISSPSGNLTSSLLFDTDLDEKYGQVANQIVAAAEAGADALHARLSEFCFTIGARLSGTPSLDQAIDWVKKEMEADGLEEVRLQKVEGVSHWVRGSEYLTMLLPRHMHLSMIGLGNSVAGDIKAEVLSVASFDELALRADEAKGKIVLFNAPFVSYGVTVAYRVGGATAAAKVGAVAALVRSVSSFSMGNPHTGAMSYASGDAENVTRIPTAALSTEHSDMIHHLVTHGKRVVVHLKMEGKLGPAANSHNVLAQVTGHSAPAEVVTVGGHIDSWDIGLGAMDDGAGLFVTWEAVRLLKALKLRPKRTVRVVAFTNEEEGGVNGVLGGSIYAKEHSNETHVLAIESDSGAFSPEGFYFLGSNDSTSIVNKVAHTLLAPINASTIMSIGFTGTDVAPLHQMYGTSSMELMTDASKYFWYHHSVADTPDKLNPLEMARCAATIAIMAYTIADLDDPLPPSPLKQ